MPGLLGKKIGITSVFSAEGKNVPCTVIEADRKSTRLNSSHASKYRMPSSA